MKIMSEIIITTDERINAIIREAVLQAFGIQQNQQVDIPDKCDLDGAFKFLNQELGYPVRKSTIYKLTANDEIPCQRFGNRLVFSRQELKNWFETKLEQKTRYNASLELAKAAQKKLRRG